MKRIKTAVSTLQNKAAFTLAEVNSLAPLRERVRERGLKRVAFTLAEVLIVLGVIGVVAALTIAPVIHKYKIKKLKTAFIKMDAIIQNAIRMTGNEYGFGQLSDLNSLCRQSDFNRNDYRDMVLFFISQFKDARKIPVSDLNKLYKNPNGVEYDSYRYMYGVYSYSSPISNAAYTLSDGSMISGIGFCHHGRGDGLSITFDTNGVNNGPNRTGYDIFLYNTGSWNMGAGNCDFVNSGNYKYRSCYKYAKKDKNPADSTKGYWESLK